MKKLCEIEVPLVVNMQKQDAPANAPTLEDRTYTSITLNTVTPNEKWRSGRVQQGWRCNVAGFS